ncbi:hypothetical protein [Pseudonocardia sp. HH130630-07]|uniref:hypothetical protein n=1 Tax=Pseudonocardia sp. HH130630-07 TaxID=1690815 RepID=UPI0012EA4D0D|nr:hypothetical protein [Pseudonocardia sp. HH130630-07]
MAARHRLPDEPGAAGEPDRPAPARPAESAGAGRLRAVLVGTVPVLFAAAVTVAAVLGTGPLGAVAPADQRTDGSVPIPTFVGGPVADRADGPPDRIPVTGTAGVPPGARETAAAAAADDAARAVAVRDATERAAARERAEEARRAEERAARERAAEDDRRARQQVEERRQAEDRARRAAVPTTAVPPPPAPTAPPPPVSPLSAADRPGEVTGDAPVSTEGVPCGPGCGRQ